MNMGVVGLRQRCRQGTEPGSALLCPSAWARPLLDHTREEVIFSGKRSISLSLKCFNCKMEIILNYIKCFLGWVKTVDNRYA